MTGQDASSAAALMQMASGLWLSRALWIAARLKIADVIDDDAASVDAIAAATKTQPDPLRRLLNALGAFGIFQADEAGRFKHTPLSRVLRSDHPSSQRAFLESIFGHEHYQAWGEIETSLRTGQTAFDAHYRMPAFDYFDQHPEAARLFGEAMTGTTHMVEDAIMQAHDFGRFDLAIDVGGSGGSLLRRILAKTPAARGVIFDLPGVAEAVSKAERISAVGGDFFKGVPEDGDLYLLKFILHDWDDDRSILILRNIREAMRPDGRVAIVEMVLPDSLSPHPGWLMDLNMLVMTGGRERTAAQYATLLDAAGFRVEQIVPTPSPMSLIIARPV